METSKIRENKRKKKRKITPWKHENEDLQTRLEPTVILPYIYIIYPVFVSFHKCTKFFL